MVPRGAPTELELPAERMRALVDRAMERIVQHVESLPLQPAADVEGSAELARSLAEGLPEGGAPFEELLSLLFDTAVPKSFNTAGPGYLAYIPGGGLFHSAVADLIADSVNRYVGVWLAAPALAQLEANVVRWFCEIVGYPPGARGILTTGGSLANFTAVVTARRDRLPEDFLGGTLYVSDQAHHSVQKAAMLAGFPPGNVRIVPSDGSYRIRIDALRARVGRDRDAGMRPFFLNGNAGTTNTGAVDDLAALADFAREEGLWYHVDGAYGGFFALTARGRETLAGIERSDSVTLDPHKALFLPYGTGSLLVRAGGVLRRAHSVRADYLPPMQEADDLVDFCEISPELSRDFRGLRVWLPFKMHGAAAFRRALDEKLDLARWAAAELRKVPGIEVFGEPALSLVAFRLAAPAVEAGRRDALNRRLLALINARRRVYLTGTLLADGFVLRICVLSFRTHLDRMEQALEDIRAAVGEVSGG
jgi:aromatic-L-amino-acid decarboxylase